MPASNVTRRFSDRVENYVWYRPGYPLQVLETLKFECGLTPARMVADIASGTGIWTRMLLEHCNPVFGVEPNAEMREAGERLLAGFSTRISFLTSKTAPIIHTSVCDGVKRFSPDRPPTVRDPNQHRRNCPIFRHFCNTSTCCRPDAAADLTNSSLSRPYRQQRDPAQHRPEPPSAQMSFRQQQPNSTAHMLHQPSSRLHQPLLQPDLNRNHEQEPRALPGAFFFPPKNS